MKKLHHSLRRTILRSIDYFYPWFKKIFPLQTYRYAAAGGVNTLFDNCLFAFAYHFVFKKHNLSLGFYNLEPTYCLAVFRVLF